MEPLEEDFEAWHRYLFSTEDPPDIDKENVWVASWLGRMVGTLVNMLPPARTQFAPQTINLAVSRVFYETTGHPRALELMPELYRLSVAFKRDDDLWDWCSDNSDDEHCRSHSKAYWQAAEGHFFRSCTTLLERRATTVELILKADPLGPAKLADHERRLLDHYLVRRAKLYSERTALEKKYAALSDKVLGNDMLQRMSEINAVLDSIPLP